MTVNSTTGAAGAASRRRARWTIAALAIAMLGLAVPASAVAAPIWRLDSTAKTTTPPGSQFAYQLQIANIGDEGTSPAGNVAASTLEIDLPQGLTALAAAGGGFSCPGAAGQSSFTCTNPGTTNGQRYRPHSQKTLSLVVDVAADASGTRTVAYEISGGHAINTASTLDPTNVTSTPPPFGFDAFDGRFVSAGSDASYTRAGGTPEAISVAIDFNRETDPFLPAAGPGSQDISPVEPPRDLFVELPPGLVGSPAAVETCDGAQLSLGDGSAASFFGATHCPPGSQVGVADVINNMPGVASSMQVGIYNMKAPPGVPARFGFNVVGLVVTMDAVVRSNGDYGITMSTERISQAVPIAGAHVTLWGVPADPEHDLLRSCPGETPPRLVGIALYEPSCGFEWQRPPEASFLRLPTSCTGPLEMTAHTDSWRARGALLEDGTPNLADPAWVSSSFTTHEPPSYPAPPSDWGSPHGITGCDSVPFNPQVKAVATSTEADSPSGLSFEISLPQSTDPGLIGSSDLKDAVVRLPEGYTVNPAAADGLAACSLEQIDLEGNNTQPRCPNAAKIGGVTIDTPLLAEPLTGSVYLAEQDDPGKPGPENPFGSLVAFYLVAEGPGVVLKLPGEVALDPATGRMTTSFRDNPQMPFRSMRVDLFGGPRSPLATPRTCGAGTLEAELTPWARPDSPVTRSANVTIASGAGGQPCASDPASRPFVPGFAAGVTDPRAGSSSPFVLRLQRPDGHQELGSIALDLPPGLTGKLAGVPYCPDATLAAIAATPGAGARELTGPSCPAATQVGVATVGAGSGPTPFYPSPGRAYLAGPYRGAPLSLAVVVPAVAGPFDLGATVVRNRIAIDRDDAQVHLVSDEFPSILSGIPLRLRDVRVETSGDFMRAPTSCREMTVGGSARSLQGATAALSTRFQVGGCAALGFKPTLKLRLVGGTDRGDHPRLRAVLRARPGDANIARTAVRMPRSAYVAQANIRTVCTRPQFAAERCPPDSVYGHASAVSPLLDHPLEGPVYMRSSDNDLPDLVADLRGPAHQPIRVELVGRTDSVRGALRTTFEGVPDVPVTRFTLNLLGGKRSLIVNSRDICKRKYRAVAQFSGQNGRRHTARPLVRARCGKKTSGAKRRTVR